MAISEQRVIVFVFLEVEIIEVCADVELFQDRTESLICDFTEAILSVNLLCIEIGDALAAHRASKDILVCIDERVNPSVSKLVDELLNLVQVRVIVSALAALYGLPHHSQSHEVHAPFFQIRDIFVVKGVLTVKVARRWDVRINLVDDINAMEDHLATKRIHKRPICRVNIDSLGGVSFWGVSDCREIWYLATCCDKICCKDRGTESEFRDRHSQMLFNSD